ncbi:LOW QUALITY PROTEIN: hypothetical protein OSB04_030488 [Centaurea solstitialis]|uniref:Cytochrome c oxidase subunit Vb n=1 Tax=Centaurea solstitialis TaxID=347529 RepID=A0AA38W3V6_9ASTR|nr:LOW QUALITY PROTEIN: hypothetical protein OSB04_030488 [Centaurea solstitialis]
MWRRASSRILALRSVARPNRIATYSPSPVILRPSAAIVTRHYSGNVSKRVEDVMPIATGHEREELEAELQGRDILDINFPEGPFGTKAIFPINLRICCLLHFLSFYLTLKRRHKNQIVDRHFLVLDSLLVLLISEMMLNLWYCLSLCCLKLLLWSNLTTTKELSVVLEEKADEHDVVWFWLKKGEPHECPVCTQYFVLEVVGPGGPPDGHGDDEHHHH